MKKISANIENKAVLITGNKIEAKITPYIFFSPLNSFTTNPAATPATVVFNIQAKIVPTGEAEKKICIVLGEMITIRVESRKPYLVSYDSFDIHEVANVERKVPLDWIINDGTYVSSEYIDYARPLIMGEIEPYYSEGVPQHLSLSKE